MYKLKKILSSRSVSLISASLLYVTSILVAQAATLGPNAVYDMVINPAGSCFAFGDCTALVDNIPGGTIQVATTDDGAGGVTFSVNSYAMASYTGTPGGFFATFADGAYADWDAVSLDGLFLPGGISSGGDTSLMAGSVDVSGNIIYVPTGRRGAAQFFPLLGTPLWNVDDALAIFPGPPAVDGTGLVSSLVSGSSSAIDPSTGVADLNTLTGVALDLGLNATLVSSSNIGVAWGAFAGTPYTEVYNVTFSLVSADPLAVDDTVATPQATPIIIDVANDLFVNDIHAANEVLTLDSFTQPVDPLSSVIDSGGGTLTYTPNPALVGPGADSFTYTVADEGLQTDTATVFINLTTGTAPVANDDTVATNEDTAITFDPVAGSGATAGVVDDTDVDTGTASLIIVSNTAATNGVVTIVLNDVTYTPAANFNGADNFTYTIEDPSGNPDTATVTINVAAINDAPVCSDVSLITPVDTPLTIDAANDLLSTTSVPPLCTDVEGDAITLATFDTTSTSGGTITTDGGMPETLTYTPPTGFEGVDTFTFTATDDTDNAAPNTVTINVANPTLGNFTMLDSAGDVFGGTNDITFDWDNTFNVDESDATFGKMTIISEKPQPFFNFFWAAHHVRVYDEGSYSFDTSCTAAQFDAGTTSCGGSVFITMTVAAGQIGGHILFDWGKVSATTPCGVENCDIDVVNVWDKNAVWDRHGHTGDKQNALWAGEAGLPPDPVTTWELVSTDVNGDSYNGSPMVDGPFQGFYASFNSTPGASAGPREPIVMTQGDTKLGSSILASMNIIGLFASFMTLLGLRYIGRTK